MKWEPIETAPKDGTRFLAATDSGYQLILQWCDGEYFRCSRDHEWMPAHWMPLPDPPNEPRYTITEAGRAMLRDAQQSSPDRQQGEG